MTLKTKCQNGRHGPKLGSSPPKPSQVDLQSQNTNQCQLLHGSTVGRKKKTGQSGIAGSTCVRLTRLHRSVPDRSGTHREKRSHLNCRSRPRPRLHSSQHVCHGIVAFYVHLSSSPFLHGRCTANVEQNLRAVLDVCSIYACRYPVYWTVGSGKDRKSAAIAVSSSGAVNISRLHVVKGLR